MDDLPKIVIAVNISCCNACYEKLTKLMTKLLKTDGAVSFDIDKDGGLVTVNGNTDPGNLVKSISKAICKKKTRLVLYEQPKKKAPKKEVDEKSSANGKEKAKETEGEQATDGKGKQATNGKEKKHSSTIDLHDYHGLPMDLHSTRRKNSNHDYHGHNFGEKPNNHDYHGLLMDLHSTRRKNSNHDYHGHNFGEKHNNHDYHGHSFGEKHNNHDYYGHNFGEKQNNHEEHRNMTDLHNTHNANSNHFGPAPPNPHYPPPRGPVRYGPAQQYFPGPTHYPMDPYGPAHHDVAHQYYPRPNNQPTNRFEPVRHDTMPLQQYGYPYPQNDYYGGREARVSSTNNVCDYFSDENATGCGIM